MEESIHQHLSRFNRCELPLLTHVEWHFVAWRKGEISLHVLRLNVEALDACVGGRPLSTVTNCCFKTRYQEFQNTSIGGDTTASGYILNALSSPDVWHLIVVDTGTGRGVVPMVIGSRLHLLTPPDYLHLPLQATGKKTMIKKKIKLLINGDQKKVIQHHFDTLNCHVFISTFCTIFFSIRMAPLTAR